MARKSRFAVEGKLDKAGQFNPGSVVIARSTTPMFIVRPKGRRRVYELPLSSVADMVVLRVITAELRAKKAAKATKRKAGQ